VPRAQAVIVFLKRNRNLSYLISEIKNISKNSVVFFLKRGVFASHLINTTKEREGKQNEN